MLCFRTFPVAKKFMDKRGWVQDFPLKFCLSQSAEKFRMGNLLCCVSEYFRFRKILDKRGVRYQGFPSKIFCLRVPKILYGKHSLLCFRTFPVPKIYG